MKTQKELIKELEISHLCKEIAQLTWDNEHTSAKIALASYYRLYNFVRIFNAIDEIHNTEGSMPSDLAAYRRRKGEELLTVIAIADPENIEQIKNAF